MQDVAIAKASEINGFSIFGLGTSDSINAIIAFVAVIGFVGSFIISIYSLKRTRDAMLIDKRCEIIQYFLLFFSRNWNNKPQGEEYEKLHIYTMTFRLFFNNCNRLVKVCSSLLKYYDGMPLPDYTEKFREKLEDVGPEKKVLHAFLFEALHGIEELTCQIGSSKNSLFLKK